MKLYTFSVDNMIISVPFERCSMEDAIRKAKQLFMENQRLKIKPGGVLSSYTVEIVKHPEEEAYAVFGTDNKFTPGFFKDVSKIEYEPL